MGVGREQQGEGGGELGQEEKERGKRDTMQESKGVRLVLRW